MGKPKRYTEFGRLLAEGIKRAEVARRETSQQTHQYLADQLGYGITTLYVWRRGEHLPDDPEAVARLARIFVQTWQADQGWIHNFLIKGEYGPSQAIEKLFLELFGEGLSDSQNAGLRARTDTFVDVTNKSDLSPSTRWGHRLWVAFFDRLAGFAFKILTAAPDWLVGDVLNRMGSRAEVGPANQVMLFQPACGDKGIDLAEQRLLVSSAFGTYFAGLLERGYSYINLRGQIEVQGRPEQAGLEPIQSLYWALHYPKGPRIVIIAAEGGMGKSTLAAKLVRCLFEEQAIDMILGDSAKTQQVDPVSGHVIRLEPGYYDPTTFYRRLYGQLGLPDQEEALDSRSALRNIRDRLEGRRAMILIDNLETVARGTELLHAMQHLATRDARIIVTTRTVSDITPHASQVLLVRLNPLRDFENARDFLRWHIQTYTDEHPDLGRLRSNVEDSRRAQALLERTGGIPLLMQLVISDVARFSWGYLDQLPDLFGPALLDFLYQERWAELASLGEPGMQARQLLKFVAIEQYRGKKITFDRIRQWTEVYGKTVSPQAILQLLQERFLIINQDIKQGNFAVFPSLTEFLDKKDL